MILTDKALRDFYKFIFEKHNLQPYNVSNEIFLNALIIEWFDSEDKINFQDLYMTEFKNEFLMYPISSIQKEAIIKANEIYNNLNTKENEK